LRPPPSGQWSTSSMFAQCGQKLSMVSVRVATSDAPDYCGRR
jgi:hypothetical protein